MEELLALGGRLREAQAGLERDRLRRLNEQQHGVVAALTRTARALAGEEGARVSDSVAREVEQTLRAAMADPAAAAAVRSGALTGALAATGFSPVDVTGNVAVPVAASPTPAARGVPSTPEAVASARESAAAATDAAAAAERALGAADQRAAQAEARRNEAQDEVEALRHRLRESERQLTRAERATADARREQEEAAADATRARREADAADRRLQRLSPQEG